MARQFRTVYIAHRSCRTAAEVFVEDTLPENFDLIEGSLKTSFKNLDPGASVDMEYIAIPSVGDKRFLVRPAKVGYKTAKDEKLRQLLSTTPYMEILSTRQNIEAHLVKVVRPSHICCSADSSIVCPSVAKHFTSSTGGAFRSFCCCDSNAAYRARPAVPS